MVLRIKLNIPFLQEAEIEIAANQLLAQYEKRKEGALKLPLDVNFIIESVLGFSIDWQSHSLETLAFIDPNKRVICFNLDRADFFDKHVGGYEFTAAHEIGHFVLNHFEEVNTQILPNLPNEPDRFSYTDAVSDEKYKRHEFQANYFAGCLLMPKHLLLPEANQYNLRTWPIIYKLAETFTVSPSAMTRRLEDLKLIYVIDSNIFNSKEEASGQLPLI